MSSPIEVYNPMSAYNSAINKLEKNGIRATKQRRVLAKLIFDKGKRHISAENLFDEVKKYYLSYDDLMALSDSMASVFWMNPDIDLEDMAKALKGYDSDIVNKIIEYLPGKKQAMYTPIDFPLSKREVGSTNSRTSWSN